MATRIKVETNSDELPPSHLEDESFVDKDQDHATVPVAPTSMALNFAGNVVDDDDEVIREIDVYLSPEMVKQLYLLQYPLQYEEIAPTISARIKPRHGMIEIDHPLPDAIERDGLFEMTERTYHSQTIPVRTHMCLGKVKTDENNNSSLHIVPLTHITQMRPSFKHVDEAQEDPGARERKQEEDEAKAAEKKPLTFKRKESERAQMARLSSYAYKKQSEDAEEWFDLSVKDQQSMDWHAFVEKIVCSKPDQYVLMEGCNDASYIRSLNYLSTTNVTESKLLSSSAGDDVRIITSRLASLMHLGCPIPYSLIRDRFGSDVDDEKLIIALNTCSVMIRGNFCLQSKFLNMHGMLKPVRTFILLLLEEDGFVDRTRVAFVFRNSQVTEEKLCVVLDMVAKLNNKTIKTHDERRGWVPKIEDDNTFIEEHPALHKQHQEYWKQQKQRFKNQLMLYGGDLNST